MECSTMLPSQVFVSTCKRKRGPNWSEKEKQVLVEEYKRHRHILRPKGPAQSSVAEREKAWDEICTALRVVSGPYVKRDVVDVRKKWDNLCFWAKKCIAEWKEKNSSGGLQAAVSGDHSPPTLALKILAIYQDEWVDLFPNAQVVDGGDVFFVFNNDNQNTQEVPQDNKTYTDGNGDGRKTTTDEGDGDVFEIADGDEDIAEIKTECSPDVHVQEDTDERWIPDTAPEDEQNYQDFSMETQNKQHKRPANQNHISTSSLPHRFIQRRYSTNTSSPPLDTTTSLPHSSSSSSIATPHPTSSAAAAHHITSNNHLLPYHLHSSIPTAVIPNQHPHARHTINNNIPRASSPSKRMRYSQLAAKDDQQSDIDDDKDIEQLSKELLILRKEKLTLEKQKLEIEKEKLVIERDILDMQRERQWMELEKDRVANGQIN